MATRRSRIKVIANIPQRRKTENIPINEEKLLQESQTVETKSDHAISTISIDKINVSQSSTLSINVANVSLESDDTKLETPNENNTVINEIKNTKNDEIQISIDVCKPNIPPVKVEDILEGSEISLLNIQNNTCPIVENSSQSCTNNEVKSQTDITESEVSCKIGNEKHTTATSSLSLGISRRRTFIKPSVSTKALAQKAKPKLEQLTVDKLKSIPESPNIEQSNAPQDLNNQNESNHLELVENKSKTTSENEHIETVSLHKLASRTRIKATPRLAQRRASISIHGSASESEDDARKTFKRIRTESTCSTVSTHNESIRTDSDTAAKKTFNTIIQRKCRRTEQSRKLAEARRHFVHKFGNRIPEKQKLTMMDLIFYNPNTTPMSQKPKKVEERNEQKPKSPENPSVGESPIPSDEENTIPAPQIKIGANGEIVIDEQSLVIENIETKRGRENLQKSKLVDGDFDTGYGIYKREKRSKDWSKEETLFFYKALNSIGTDFNLMVSLFNGRTRKELKMKFKKEEKINRALIDKALTKPVEFNITELEEEVELSKKKALMKENEKKQNIEEWKLENKETVIPYSYIGVNKKGFKKKEVETKTKQKQKPKNKEKVKKKLSLYGKISKGITSVLNSNSEDEDSDEPIVRKKPNRTRFGRIPKSKKLSDDEEENKEESNELENLEDLKELEPGSLMILYTENPSKEPAFKVYMVTPSKDKIPINLTADVLNGLSQTMNVEENNYTIAHDNSCKTLKSCSVDTKEIENINEDKETKNTNGDGKTENISEGMEVENINKTTEIKLR